MGFANGETLKACEADAIIAYVPPPHRNNRLASQGRLTREAFHYDAATDVYRCPARTMLRPTKGRKRDVSGKLHVLYASRAAACRACPLRARCLTTKAEQRVVYRWVHEDVVERHRKRMLQADAVMRRRKALAEHPLGTLKCRAGYRHFLLRGFAKVRGQWGLMALCYNFTRVLSIIGLDGFLAHLATCDAKWAILVLAAITGAAGRLRTEFARMQTKISRNATVILARPKRCPANRWT